MKPPEMARKDERMKHSPVAPRAWSNVFLVSILFSALNACGGSSGDGVVDGCGDGVCSAIETCQSCTADCGACPPGCGDSVCASDETCDSCALDCSCPTAGIKLAGGAGITLQDVSGDGSRIAYTDGSGTLYVVATTGGNAPVMLATAVDKARYKGGFLFVFHGIDPTGKVAANAQVFDAGSSLVVRTDSQVRVKSTTGSKDGQHYAYVRDAAGARDLLLDGQVRFSRAVDIKLQFTPTSGYLVAAIWYIDPMAGSQVQPVYAFSVGGGATSTLAGDGAGLSFAIVPSGTAVIVAANDNGTLADLTRVPIAGGAGTLIVTADNKQFDVVPDGSRLVYRDAGAARTISLSGIGTVTLAMAGVTAIEDVSAQAITYATARDPVTGLENLRVARIAGTGDAELGTAAANEGSTPDGATVAARRNVVGEAGDLVVMPIATLAGATLAPQVSKSSFPDNQRIVYLTASGELVRKPLPDGARTPIQSRVLSFELVPDALGSPSRGRAAYVIATGPDAGLYITPL